jgi:hypothetical protein
MVQGSVQRVVKVQEREQQHEYDVHVRKINELPRNAFCSLLIASVVSALHTE